MNVHFNPSLVNEAPKILGNLNTIGMNSPIMIARVNVKKCEGVITFTFLNFNPKEPTTNGKSKSAKMIRVV
jgi:hypothetical protein